MYNPLKHNIKDCANNDKCQQTVPIKPGFSDGTCINWTPGNTYHHEPEKIKCNYWKDNCGNLCIDSPKSTRTLPICTSSNISCSPRGTYPVKKGDSCSRLANSLCPYTPNAKWNNVICKNSQRHCETELLPGQILQYDCCGGQVRCNHPTPPSNPNGYPFDNTLKWYTYKEDDKFGCDTIAQLFCGLQTNPSDVICNYDSMCKKGKVLKKGDILQINCSAPSTKNPPSPCIPLCESGRTWTYASGACSKLSTDQCEKWVDGTGSYTKSYCEISGGKCISSPYKVCTCMKAKGAGYDCCGINYYSPQRISSCASGATRLPTGNYCSGLQVYASDCATYKGGYIQEFDLPTLPHIKYRCVAKATGSNGCRTLPNELCYAPIPPTPCTPCPYHDECQKGQCCDWDGQCEAFDNPSIAPACVHGKCIR